LRNDPKLKDFIKIYDGVLPANFSKEIIDNFEKMSEHHELSKVGSSENTKNEYRQAIEMNCSICSDEDKPWQGIISILNNIAMEYQKKYIKDIGVKHIPYSRVLEEWRMHRYDKGEHFYKSHVDSENSESSNRMLAFLFYLNDVESGGQTAFTDHLDGITCKPALGRLLIFPTWFGFPHEAKLVIEGTKYMIKTFVHYPGDT